MKKYLIIGGLILSAFLIMRYDHKARKRAKIMSEKSEQTMAECQEWKSKRGTFMFKYGPFRNAHEPRDPRDKDREMDIRSCHQDREKRMTVGEEHTPKSINSPCHFGYKWKVDMTKSPEEVASDFYDNICWYGEKPTRVVKTWSWETN